MKIIYSQKHKQHNPHWQFFDGKKTAAVELPERIENIARFLKTQSFGTFIKPEVFSESLIEAVHKKHYISFLREKSLQISKNNELYPSDFILDTYTPLQKYTFNCAKNAIDCCLTGAKLLSQGEQVVYSLCRPPGHHAEVNRMGGFCYFNNAAVAAEYLSKKGNVAILDLDLHHGNGTQNIFYERNDVFYISLHGDPRTTYPYVTGFENETGRGQGEGYNRNFTLSKRTRGIEYLKILKKALRLIRTFAPNYLIVSMGFDTYINDPCEALCLNISDFRLMGREIKLLHLPTLIIQEGGYNIEDLGKLAFAFLEGGE